MLKKTSKGIIGNSPNCMLTERSVDDVLTTDDDEKEKCTPKPAENFPFRLLTENISKKNRPEVSTMRKSSILNA